MSVWAFLDESGDPNLAALKGSTTHFAVAAIIVPEHELDQRRAAVEAVRSQFFQTGMIRSQTVAAKMHRRLRVLEALRDTGCSLMGLVVDKRRIRSDSGLQFRRSFIKYLDRFVYERLFRAYPVLHVRADQIGRQDFMDSFESYLTDHCSQTDLFETAPDIEFVRSDSEVLVQAADFVAGSLRIAYSDDTSNDDAKEILARLAPCSLGVQEWPATPRTTAVTPPASADATLDAAIRSAAVRSAYIFLADSEDAADDGTRMQVDALQELLHALRFEDSNFLAGELLAERLVARGFVECTRDTVRRSVVAPLRDKEVLIVSSARGYGLAASAQDLDAHLKRMEEEVRPILRRVETMDTQLRTLALGRETVLASERFAYLKALVDTHMACERSPERRASGDAS